LAFVAVIYYQTFLLLAALAKTIRWLWYVSSDLLSTPRIQVVTDLAMRVKTICLLFVF
jgi:hypothetical protein